MKKFIRLALYAIIWILAAIVEFALIFSGFIAQGHDKARLIVLALAIVCLPVLAYGLHRVVRFIFSDSVSDQPEVKR